MIRSILDNKVGHLLSEFSIKFALELWCRISFSKVTNKLSESWCRMHVQCGLNPSSSNRWPTLIYRFWNLIWTFQLLFFFCVLNSMWVFIFLWWHVKHDKRNDGHVLGRFLRSVLIQWVEYFLSLSCWSVQQNSRHLAAKNKAESLIRNHIVSLWFSKIINDVKL